ncbi:MAG: peptidylprolyl isomerase [Ruminococcaceae bacterium]|nr:peptidylprolyl isomerase [Oscillospiraceae bacterium]
MKYIKIISFILIFTMAFSLAACSNEEKKEEKVNLDPIAMDSVVTSEGEPERVRIGFDVENYGEFVVETYSEHAPDTVNHFLELVDNGCYNGYTVEKINPGLAILSSDHSHELTSDSAAQFNNTVSGEFSANGRSNALKLDRYTLALNHIPSDYNSGMSQFMIFLSSNHDLDGKYAGFAKVVEGTQIIDKIAGVETDSSGRPVLPIVMKKVYIKR